MTWLRFTFWPIGVHMLVWSLLPVVVCMLALAAGRSTYDRIHTTGRLDVVQAGPWSGW